ncbi:hypothetical protein FS749_005064 [Ceratobasidium sp. UAMH 11750]|nr:hypothetical protein FS749_005064 [Ceratobasidium sp. UAMH 11750]
MPPRRPRSPENDDAEHAQPPPKQRKRDTIRELQERLREVTESNQRMQEENAALRQQRGDHHEAGPGPEAARGNARLNKADIRFWGDQATIAGRKTAAMHGPFVEGEALADQQVEAHMGDIVDKVKRAKEPDNDLPDEENPALYWDTPCFDIPGPVEIARDLIFHLPRSLPGNLWFDQFFQDKLQLGIRKQRGDIVYAVAKNHEKIFDIGDPAFEDRAQRCEMPEVQRLLKTFMHTSEADPPNMFFKDACIVRVLRLLLNGSSAIRTGRRSPKARKPHVEMWHVKFITPSLLAFAATVIKFVLSGSFYDDQPDLYNDLIDYYNREVLPDRYQEMRFENRGDNNNERADYREGINEEERAFLNRIHPRPEN